MKKTLIIFILLAIICFSCKQSNTTQAPKQYPGSIDEYVYDGHEYVVFGGQWGGHKGNCKFCKQEVDSLKEIIKEQAEEIKDFKSRLLPKVGLSVTSFWDCTSTPDVTAETRWNMSDSSYVAIGQAKFRFVKASKLNRIGSEYVLYRVFP